MDKNKIIEQIAQHICDLCGNESLCLHGKKNECIRVLEQATKIYDTIIAPIVVENEQLLNANRALNYLYEITLTQVQNNDDKWQRKYELIEHDLFDAERYLEIEQEKSDTFKRALELAVKRIHCMACPVRQECQKDYYEICEREMLSEYFYKEAQEKKK